MACLKLADSPANVVNTIGKPRLAAAMALLLWPPTACQIFNFRFKGCG